jgi:hypothetical protein
VCFFEPTLDPATYNRLSNNEDGLSVSLETSTSVIVASDPATGFTALSLRTVASQTVTDEACEGLRFQLLTNTAGMGAFFSESTAFTLSQSCGGVVTKVEARVAPVNSTGSNIACTANGLRFTPPKQIVYQVVMDDPNFDIETLVEGSHTSFTIVDRKL